MKNVLFATTATTALLIGGIASAQGIALFGDARLGLGYNINNEGGVTGDDDIRAVSRVRFGVNMTGETDSGITFGATIRADNAKGGQGSATGQTDGSVFVSGSWGTLTLGDTAGADEKWVGDVPGNFSLTGLGDNQETLFLTNGGSYGDDLVANPSARPTIRYDFDIAGFGVSVSSNRDLTDVAVGLGYTLDTGMGGFTIAGGYATIDGFQIEQSATLNSDGTINVTPASNVNDVESWSAGITGDFANFDAGVVWISNDGDNADFQELLVGLDTTIADFGVGAYYVNILSADGGLADVDGNDAYGLTATYDLGGGASINGGVAKTLDEGETVADFGIKMAF